MIFIWDLNRAKFQKATIGFRKQHVFVNMFESGEDALDIVERKGLTQISDAGAILELVESVISDNASKVAEFRNGKDKLFGFFVGQVMKKSQGKANPKLVNNLLKDKLG